ncbi:MAG TPA: cytochrome c biogenesis protein CcdA, partial [Polyangiaceae bacterium]
MLDAILGNVQGYLTTNPWLALVAVFLGGLLTASNPCVLAMVPLMLSVVAGQKNEKTSVGQAAGFAGVFVVGLGITFTAMGMIAALAGRMYGDVSTAWNYVVALVCIVMGLHLANVFTLPIPAIGSGILPKTRGSIGALLLGMLFGMVSAPCAAPILIVLLTYLSGAGASVAWGGT